MKKNIEPLILKFVPVPFSIKEEGGIHGGQLIYSLKEKTSRLFFKLGQDFTPIDSLIKDFSAQFCAVEPYLVSLDEEVSSGDWCIAYGKDGSEITSIKFGVVVYVKGDKVKILPHHAKTNKVCGETEFHEIDQVFKIIVKSSEILMPQDAMVVAPFDIRFNAILNNNGDCEIDTKNGEIIKDKNGKIEVKFCADNYKKIEDL